MNVGILANPHKPGSIPTLQALRAALGAKGISTVLEEQTAILAGETGGIPAASFSRHVELAAVIGGDGTMLHALSRLGDFEKPVAGINIGTLGFLTSCKDDELDVFAAALAEGALHHQRPHLAGSHRASRRQTDRLIHRPQRDHRSPAAKPDASFPSGRG